MPQQVIDRPEVGMDTCESIDGHKKRQGVPLRAHRVIAKLPLHLCPGDAEPDDRIQAKREQ